MDKGTVFCVERQRMMTIALAVGMATTLLVVLTLVGSVAQPLQYHEFADQRAMLEIPHAWNVLSNAFFSLGGFVGLVMVYRRMERRSAIGRLYLVFFTGLFLTGLGSGYYHLMPENLTLVWDRLPITIAFMAFVTLVIHERVSKKLAEQLFLWLMFAGIISVFYWYWLDDLRPYLVLQFGTMLVLPVIIWRFPGRGSIWLWLTVLFYTVAKVLEVLDHQVFELSQQIVSGHTLKHLAASIGALMILAKAHFAYPKITPVRHPDILQTTKTAFCFKPQ